MITMHKVSPRWSPRYNRWYAYTESGVLFYLDFSFASAGDPVEPGKDYEILGKIYAPAQRVENGPAFSLMVAAYSLLQQPVADPAVAAAPEVPIL